MAVATCPVYGQPEPPHVSHCRAWARAATGEGVTCRLHLAERTVQRGDRGVTYWDPHPGDHRDGAWSWRTGQTPTRPEARPQRPADPADLTALCRELRDLAAALDAALPGGVRADRSQVRRVPRSGAPLDLEALLAGEELVKGVASLTRDLRQALGHATGWRTMSAALAAVPDLVSALPDGHPLRRRVPAVLEALRNRARHLLNWDRDWLPVGPCPATWRDDPVDALTRDGLVEGDVGCWSLDGRATAAAAARGEDTKIWRRSILAIPRDADASRATVVCRACGYTCTPEQRAADIILASGQDLVLPARQAAHLLALPEPTFHTWRRRGLITPVGEERPPRYSVAAVARVIVARRAAMAAA